MEMKVLEKGTTTELIKESLDKATSYQEYRTLVEDMVTEGKSTGENQTEELSNYTMLNHKRMKRWDKTLKVNDNVASSVDRKITWLVLTESWCGDAAHSMPVMNKVAELNPNITYKVLLRDENLELMNHFLTNNAMSIPKLIMVDDETKEVLGDWGSRPSIATDLVNDYKKEHGKLTPEFKQDLQVWYNKDKGQNMLSDLEELLTLKNISNSSYL